RRAPSPGGDRVDQHLQRLRHGGALRRLQAERVRPRDERARAGGLHAGQERLGGLEHVGRLFQGSSPTPLAAGFWEASAPRPHPQSRTANPWPPASSTSRPHGTPAALTRENRPKTAAWREIFRGGGGNSDLTGRISTPYAVGHLRLSLSIVGAQP